ncbi:MAG: hypothetical protein ACXW3Z_01710 [Limisphaerales bacterium]
MQTEITYLGTGDWRDLPGLSPVIVPLEQDKTEEYFRLRVQ